VFENVRLAENNEASKDIHLAPDIRLELFVPELNAHVVDALFRIDRDEAFLVYIPIFNVPETFAVIFEDSETFINKLLTVMFPGNGPFFGSSSTRTNVLADIDTGVIVPPAFCHIKSVGTVPPAAEIVTVAEPPFTDWLKVTLFPPARTIWFDTRPVVPLVLPMPAEIPAENTVVPEAAPEIVTVADWAFVLWLTVILFPPAKTN